MISTMLIGGLGNQMFQYAAGRALALRHGTGLALDQSSFAKAGADAIPRRFELDRLAIQAVPARCRRSLAFLLARRRQAALVRLSGWQPLREASLSYDPRVERAGNDTYLIGYWQSWRYFTGRETEIAAELQPRVPLSARTRAMQSTMRCTPSLSLHVRRGDYLLAAHNFHGALDLNFYLEAVRRVRAIEPNVTIYVFSDDLDWCRQAFALLDWNATFVDWNRGEDDWQDLYLMSACRHAVVANSSFSWWGAWLGDLARNAATRVVVAPGRWFAGGTVSASDRCPPSWTVV